MTETKDETKMEEQQHSKGGESWLWKSIAKFPLLFCVLVPALLVVCVAVGFTREDYVEESMAAIWIADTDQLKQNQDYLDSVGKQEFTRSSFAAMAVARDGGNLFTESRLEEIRARMNAVDAMTVEHNGNTFTWEDVCAISGLGAGTGTTYRFPCARISPMDLFQETRHDYFDNQFDRLTWYHGVVKGSAINPRVLRFGILQQVCVSTSGGSGACDKQALLRTNPDFAEANGYPREYANPLGLIGDVGSLEFNDPCRICIEEGLEAQMDQLQNQLIVPFFTVLAMEFERYQQSLDENSEEYATLGDLANKAKKIAASVDRKATEDFFYFQVIRATYAELGASAYQSTYNQLVTPERLPYNCTANPPCPAFNISLEDAKMALLNHADNTFSSVTTAGSPLPFWSEADGTGVMFGGFNPVGGSGINMSADLLSGAAYLDLANYGNANAWNPMYANGFADPLTPDPSWSTLMETNPIYAWFMAGETEMTAHCGNGNLTGSATGDITVDAVTNAIALQATQRWCTPYNQPYESSGTATKQHFAREWFTLLLDSDSFLGLTQGQDDPYSWTLGAACGYTLGGERDPYTGKSDADILTNASRELYFVDEGASVGVIDRNLLIGDAIPAVSEYNFDNPLQKVGVIQSLFALLGVPEDIVDRVKNCNRPLGPINITTDDAEEILKKFKRDVDDLWTEGWDDDNHGEVQFVGFSDDVGASGTTAFFLREITLSNGTLTAISILIIAFFSCFLMASLDLVESKMGLTLVGVCLVILSYFGALGFSIICGIKVNVATAWTLPFILIGLGVDDMYIVLLSLKKEKDHSERGFMNGMREVLTPVTMTSVVNASMFAIMNVSDVPAVYLTAQVAVIAVCFLYVSIIFSFSAYCFLDMRRQEARRMDLCCCKEAPEKDEEDISNKCVGTWLSTLLYDKLFQPLVLGQGAVRTVTHFAVWAVSATLLGLAIWGITESNVGIGLEDFFPKSHQAQSWASTRTEHLGSWSIGMHWGALDYGNPETQMKMIKQFENVVNHPNVAEIDTKQLWLADFAVWTSRHCDANVAKANPEIDYCGRDQVFPGDNTTCSGLWMINSLELREKNFESFSCVPFEGGICRPTSQMHPSDLEDLGMDPDDLSEEDLDKSWCPVFEGWSNEKLGFCIKQWRFLTGGDGGLILKDEHGSPTQCAGEYYNNEEVAVPILYSGGPTMFVYNLLSHEITVDVIEETRSFCDYDEETHCWLAGIPYNYWSQYIGIEGLLVEIAGSSVAMGFGVAAIFLFVQLMLDGHHGTGKVVAGSIAGALLITITTLLCLTCVIGLAILAGVNITGFSIISFVLSVGFSVEYAVHVVSRWLHAPLSVRSASDRVHYSMSFLTLPTFMSFISSTIGVACLGFTEFEFTQVYYFRPLIIVMPVTYFFGCWWLPAFMSLLDFDFVKLGAGDEPSPAPDAERGVEPEAVESDGSTMKEEATRTDTEAFKDQIIDEVEC